MIRSLASRAALALPRVSLIACSEGNSLVLHHSWSQHLHLP